MSRIIDKLEKLRRRSNRGSIVPPIDLNKANVDSKIAEAPLPKQNEIFIWAKMRAHKNAFLIGLVFVGCLGAGYKVYFKKPPPPIVKVDPNKVFVARVSAATEMLRKKNKSDESLNELQKLVSEAPTDIGLRLYLALALKKKGEDIKARDILVAILKEHPHHVMAQNNLALLDYEKGLFQAALERFETAMGLAPEQPEIRLNLARSYEALGRYDVAIENYKLLLSGLSKNASSAKIFQSEIKTLLSERIRRMTSLALQQKENPTKNYTPQKPFSLPVPFEMRKPASTGGEE